MNFQVSPSAGFTWPPSPPTVWFVIWPQSPPCYSHSRLNLIFRKKNRSPEHTTQKGTLKITRAHINRAHGSLQGQQDGSPVQVSSEYSPCLSSRHVLCKGKQKSHEHWSLHVFHNMNESIIEILVNLPRVPPRTGEITDDTESIIRRRMRLVSALPCTLKY